MGQSSATRSRQLLQSLATSLSLSLPFVTTARNLAKITILQSCCALAPVASLLRQSLGVSACRLLSVDGFPSVRPALRLAALPYHSALSWYPLVRESVVHTRLSLRKGRPAECHRTATPAQPANNRATIATIRRAAPSPAVTSCTAPQTSRNTVPCFRSVCLCCCPVLTVLVRRRTASHGRRS